MTQVSARIGTENRGKVDDDGNSLEKVYNVKLTVDYDFRTKDLDAKIKDFGGDAVDVHAERSMIVALRNQVTNWIRAGKTQEEVNELVKDWKPTAVAVKSKKTKLQRATEAAKDMTSEELDALMKDLKGLQKATK